MRQLLGAHNSISGGVSKAVDIAIQLEFTAMQIFSKNSNRWINKPLQEKEIADFKEKREKSLLEFICVHDTYLINLCAVENELLVKSQDAFIEEVERCRQLEIEYLNFHPGSHCGAGEAAGIKKIAESVNIVHDKTAGSGVMSMIEVTAGQGTALGYRFEHIRDMIDLIEDKERTCVCIDTAHIFAAGYDIRSAESYQNTMAEFDRVIGMDKLKCIHINDSKKELGSRVDRHEHIGKGFIGEEGFRNIMNDSRLANVPKILETPKGKDLAEDIENIRVLKSLIEV